MSRSHVGYRCAFGVHSRCTVFALCYACDRTKALNLIVAPRLGTDEFWWPARGQDPRGVLSFANLVEVGGTDSNGPRLQVLRVRNLKGISEESVAWELHRDAGFVFCPTCRSDAIFHQDFGNWFPACFVVADVSTGMFSFVDVLPWEARGNRDGQQAFRFDEETTCSSC